MDQVFRFYVQQYLAHFFRVVFTLDVRTKTDATAGGRAVLDIRQPVKGPAADKQDVGR